MRKMAALLAGVALMMVTSGAMATTLDVTNVRPVTVPAEAYPGEATLQQELDKMFGPGLDVNKDQLAVGMFKVAAPGSNVLAPQFEFEWTGNAPTQEVGIFGWNGTQAQMATIFDGTNVAGDVALLTWTGSDSGIIRTFGLDGGQDTRFFSGISKTFFGFFFQATPNSQAYFTTDSLNPNGEARVLGYDGNKVEPGSGMMFAYEDGTDWDYNDGGFFVESIAPVPEPGTMMLLGAGFLGLAIYGKRRRNVC